jgi:ribose transport system substrate-binding protein
VKSILIRTLSVLFVASGVFVSAVTGLEAKTLGIVALLANDALNVAVIAGATDAAKAAGWDVKVVDTQASADQANAAMSTFAVQKVDAIFVLAFASTSIGAGMAAANAADIPVATWGGEIVPGIVVTTSGMTVGEESAKFLLDKVGDNAEILAMTFHPGKLCIDRGDAFDSAVKGKSGLSVTYNEVTVPGQVQNGNAITQPWLTAHPAGGKKPLAIWACWDEPTQGAVAALRQAGRTDVTTVSINGSPQALQLVKDGDLTATVWQPAYQEGKAAFQAILDSIKAGKSWQPKTIEIPGVVVTKDNVDKFLADHPNGL